MGSERVGPFDYWRECKKVVQRETGEVRRKVEWEAAAGVPEVWPVVEGAGAGVEWVASVWNLKFLVALSASASLVARRVGACVV